MRVTDLHLSILARVCLLKADIETVDQLVKHSADDLLYRLDFDPYELYEIVCRLNERGFNLRAYRRRLPNDRRGCPESRRTLSGGPPASSVAVGSVLGE
jgi:DNA-directed RNA polymerase alpha subunit